MTDIKERIEEIAVDDKSGWLEKARYRRENRGWLRKSQEVAIKVLQTLDENSIQQKELAEAMDVSPQQISKIVKGKQNLTLQTITKLEQVLDISLFEVPRHPNTVKVESKKGTGASYNKKSEHRYTTKDPLEKVLDSSWNPNEQRKSKLTLVA
jgi:plasmid maintenance system antidote protein VapI